LVRLLTPNYTVGALCLIEHEEQLLLLRQRHRHGWTLPGGLARRGETVETTACREVLEETGLVIEVGVPIGVVVEPDSRWIDVLFHIPVDTRPQVRAASEAIGADWLRPDDAGEVDDSTRRAFAMFLRNRHDRTQTGRLLSTAQPPT
jgi:8-oxo-dGTP pyrophosphatase MutT (NUDIX family)